MNKINMDKIPTINTVAEKAGVSRATVSRVLNNYPIVSEEKKKKVLDAIKEIGFEPNRIAQILTGKKTKTIGVLLENTTNPLFGKILNGIEATLKKHGYLTILGNSEYIHEEKINIIKQYNQYRMDGIIASLIGYNDNEDAEVLKLLVSTRIPFILINSSVDAKGIPWVVTDATLGGYMAADHLIKLGHKKIMYFTFDKLRGMRKKYEGFKKALKENKLNLEDQIIIDGAISKSDGYKLMNGYIEQNGVSKIPSAILTTNDIVAVGVMEALIECGVKIPDDVSIVGFDDIDMAGFLQIPLTTIHQPQYKEGVIAATELIHKIEKGSFKKGGKYYLLTPELVIRKSTATFKPKNDNRFAGRYN
jgi:LacI family transcriptional regulator